MPTAPVLEPRTLLLVQGSREDERIALRALRWCEPPLLVRSVRGGERAIHALGLGDGTPDSIPELVVCDLRLPDWNAEDLIRLARADARLRDVPFILLSRVPEPAEVERALAAGAAAVLRRPIAYEGCLGLFQAIVDGAFADGDPARLEPFAPLPGHPGRGSL